MVTSMTGDRGWVFGGGGVEKGRELFMEEVEICGPETSVDCCGAWRDAKPDTTIFASSEISPCRAVNEMLESS